MSSTHYGHHRTSPPSTRKPAVKPARPAPLGASKVSLKSNGKTKQPTEKAKKEDQHTVVDDDEDEDDDDDDMATSFDQFW